MLTKATNGGDSNGATTSGVPIMNEVHRNRSVGAKAIMGLTALGIAAATALSIGLGTATASPGQAQRVSRPFTFRLVPAPHVRNCLPRAGGKVTITPGGLNDTMKVSIYGMPPRSDF